VLAQATRDVGVREIADRIVRARLAAITT